MSIYKRDFIEVKVNHKLYLSAEDMEAKRTQNWKSTDRYTYRPDFIGAIGELAVYKFLYSFNRACKFLRTEGASDGGADLIVEAGTIDVKTSWGVPSVWHEMAVKETQHHSADYFVKCF